MYKILGISLVILILVFAGFLIIQYREDNNSFKYLVNDTESLKKVSIELKSPSGRKRIDIVSKGELDSFQNALKEAAPIIKGNRGKAFAVWGYVWFYKGNKTIKSEITYSKYNGWYASIGSKEFYCEYLFQVVNRSIQ